MAFVSSHARNDRRGRALLVAAGRKLLADPSLLEIARENIRRWLPASGGARGYLETWQRMLELPLEELVRKMGEESEEMDALRQCSPFAGVLTARERWAVLEDCEER